MFNEAVFFVVLDDSAETPGRCRGRGGDDRGDGSHATGSHGTVIVVMVVVGDVLRRFRRLGGDSGTLRWSRW